MSFDEHDLGYLTSVFSRSFAFMVSTLRRLQASLYHPFQPWEDILNEQFTEGEGALREKRTGN